MCKLWTLNHCSVKNQTTNDCLQHVKTSWCYYNWVSCGSLLSSKKHESTFLSNATQYLKDHGFFYVFQASTACPADKRVLLVCKWVRSTGGMILTGEIRCNGRKTYQSDTLSTSNPTWTDRGSKPGLHGEKPVTNCLSHGTVLDIQSEIFAVVSKRGPNRQHLMYCVLLTICTAGTTINAVRYFSHYCQRSELHL
jgi:hypothetical protein